MTLEIEPEKVPKHIAAIMDGNRRWAKEKGLNSFEGHKKGYERLRKILDISKRIGVKYLTVYAFSTENLKKRSEDEKKYLFECIIVYLGKSGE